MDIRWEPAVAIGVDAIDVLQRALYESASRAAEAAARGGELAPAIVALRAAAARLFEAEEALLLAAESLALVRHRAQHAQFLADLDGVVADLARGGPDAILPAALATWIPVWLDAHVGGTDRELARLAAREATAAAPFRAAARPQD